MTEKTTSTIKRHLTPSVQGIAEQLVRRFGTLRIVLSAGVLALYKLTAEEREKRIDEANAESSVKSSPEELLEKLKEIFMKEEGNKMMFTSTEVAKIISDFRRKMAPSKEESHNHLKRNKA